MEGGVERLDASEMVVNDEEVDSRLRRHNFEGDNDNNDRDGLGKFVGPERVRCRDSLSELKDMDHFLRVLGGFEIVELDACVFRDN